MARLYDTQPSGQSNRGRRATPRLTRLVSRRRRGRSCCALTSPPRYRRVLTIIASAIQTLPPCYLTRRALAWPWPRSWGGSTTDSCTAWPCRARPGPPRCAGAFVQAKSGHTRVPGVLTGEPEHDDDGGRCRGVQSIEDRACCGTERLTTLRAEVASILTCMDTTMALTDLASIWTCHVGSECRCGVHECPPSSGGEPPKRSRSGPPFALQAYLTTLKWRATSYDNLSLLRNKG